MTIVPEPDEFGGMTTRDLVVRLLTKFEGITEAIADLKERVTDLERNSDTQKGMVTGAKFLFDILRTLPVAALAFIFGKEGL